MADWAVETIDSAEDNVGVTDDILLRYGRLSTH